MQLQLQQLVYYRACNEMKPNNPDILTESRIGGNRLRYSIKDAPFDYLTNISSADIRLSAARLHLPPMSLNPCRELSIMTTILLSLSRCPLEYQSQSEVQYRCLLMSTLPWLVIRLRYSADNFQSIAIDTDGVDSLLFRHQRTSP